MKCIRSAPEGVKWENGARAKNSEMQKTILNVRR